MTLEIFREGLQGCIDGFLITGILGILGKRLKFQKMITISFFYAIIINCIRYFYLKNNIPLGTHTILAIIFMVILLKMIGQQNIFDSIIATIFSMCLISAGEIFFLVLFDWKIIGIQLPRFIMFLLSRIFLTTFFIIGRKKTLIDFNKFNI